MQVEQREGDDRTAFRQTAAVRDGRAAVWAKVSETDLSVVLPHLRMLPTQNLTIKIPIPLPGRSLRVRLPPNLHMLPMVQRNMLRDETVVQGVEV